MNVFSPSQFFVVPYWCPFSPFLGEKFWSFYIILFFKFLWFFLDDPFSPFYFLWFLIHDPFVLPYFQPGLYYKYGEKTSFVKIFEKKPTTVVGVKNRTTLAAKKHMTQKSSAVSVRNVYLKCSTQFEPIFLLSWVRKGWWEKK